MRIHHSPDHALHHGRCELIDGQLQPCFEKPQRVEFILAECHRRQLGEGVPPKDFGRAPLARIHSTAYLDFLAGAWDEWAARGYFNSTKYMTDIANGDICVAVGYSGSFYQFGNRAKEAGNGVVVDWRLPREGAPIWLDTWAIPASAKNVDQAHAFINYLLEPKVIAGISDYLGYPNANKPGMPLVTAAIRDNHDLVPTPEMLKKLYVVQPLPQPIERVRTRAWSRIKAGN